jgi:hypothetical protein
MFFFNTWLRFIGMLKIEFLKVVCEGCLVGRHHCFVGFCFDKCFGPKQWRCPYFLCQSEFLFLQQQHSHVFWPLLFNLHKQFTRFINLASMVFSFFYCPKFNMKPQQTWLHSLPTFMILQKWLILNLRIEAQRTLVMIIPSTWALPFLITFTTKNYVLFHLSQPPNKLLSGNISRGQHPRWIWPSIFNVVDVDKIFFVLWNSHKIVSYSWCLFTKFWLNVWNSMDQCKCILETAKWKCIVEMHNA